METDRSVSGSPPDDEGRESPPPQPNKLESAPELDGDGVALQGAIADATTKTRQGQQARASGKASARYGGSDGPQVGKIATSRPAATGAFPYNP